MEKPYEITPSERLIALYKKFSKAITKDGAEKTTRHLEAVQEETFFRCMDWVRKNNSAKLPALRVKFLNEVEFNSLRSRLGIGGSGYAFIEHVRNLIAVNIQALLTHGFEPFVLNLIITFNEELLHAAFPLMDEVSIKKLAYETTEKFLDFKIPEEYKQASYEMAADPSYGK